MDDLEIAFMHEEPGVKGLMREATEFLEGLKAQEEQTRVVDDGPSVTLVGSRVHCICVGAGKVLERL